MINTEKKIRLEHIQNILSKKDTTSPYSTEVFSKSFLKLQEDLTEKINEIANKSQSIGLDVFALTDQLASTFLEMEMNVENKIQKTNFDSKNRDKSITNFLKKEMSVLDSLLKGYLDAEKLSKKELKEIIKKIEKDIEELFWVRSANGSNNVQAVLNIKSGGTTVANNVTGINFFNGTVVVNPDGTITYTSQTNDIWMPPETPSGAINGVNATYTLSYVPVTNSGFLFQNAQYLTEGTDWTISYNIITMTTPMSALLSGFPFVFKGQFFKAIPPLPPSTNSFLIQDGSTLTLQDASDLLLNP